jgi:hypothetical protein
MYWSASSPPCPDYRELSIGSRCSPDDWTANVLGGNNVDGNADAESVDADQTEASEIEPGDGPDDEEREGDGDPGPEPDGEARYGQHRHGRGSRRRRPRAGDLTSFRSTWPGGHWGVAGPGRVRARTSVSDAGVATSVGSRSGSNLGLTFGRWSGTGLC